MSQPGWYILSSAEHTHCPAPMSKNLSVCGILPGKDVLDEFDVALFDERETDKFVDFIAKTAHA